MAACGLGPSDVRARVSDRRLLSALLRSLGIAEAADAAVFAAVDKIDREDRAELIRRLGTAGVPADASERLLELVRASDFDALRRDFSGQPDVEAALDRFDQYRGYLDAHGVLEYLQLDLTIVRGLAYYTGIVFELFDAWGEFRAICGGGRYDTLLQALGGVDMPALGFGMGYVVLAELLKARGLMPSGQPTLDFWVAPLSAEYRLDAIRVATQLRRAGATVETPIREQSLGKQMKAADAVGARDVIMVGETYRASGQVEVKRLADGQQTIAPWSAVVEQARTRPRGTTDRP
jgi:histidyl-tRNA synthetase